MMKDYLTLKVLLLVKVVFHVSLSVLIFAYVQHDI